MRTPAGIDIKARSPAEIGLSIVAEIVQVLRAGAPGTAEVARAETTTAETTSAETTSGETTSGRPAVAARARPRVRPETTVDPVCGMVVVVGPHTPHRLVDGVERWFCSAGCRDAFVA